jgi:hypothetical protein
VRKEFLKALPTWLVILVGMAGVLGCERDLPYMATADQPINGYQIEGYVTDKLGIPIKGLKIALWYDLDYIDSNTPPSRQFLVDDTTAIARVIVVDPQNKLRRVLFQGRAKLGFLDFEFDLRDSAGVLLPTGIYTISFSLNGITKGSYSQVVNGAVTAVTDSLGHYVIPNDFLPIGFYPAPIYAGDGVTFIGNYQISPYVYLEFYLPVHRSASVTLTQNQITRFDYRI